MAKTEKKILLLMANGEFQTLLPHITPITLKLLQNCVGGYVEHVRVLDRVEEDGRFVYTSMYVHEEGLLLGLPRNEQATKIYQRNCRAAYPNAENPFQEAKKALAERVGPGFTIIDAPIPEAPGYENDPWISGPAVFFGGYTCDEVNEMLDAGEAA